MSFKAVRASSVLAARACNRSILAVVTAATVCGCSAPDRSLLFGDSGPSQDSVVAAGSGGSTTAQGSGGVFMAPSTKPDQSAGGTTSQSPGSTMPPSLGSAAPPGSGGAPPAMGSGGAGVGGSTMAPTMSLDAGPPGCNYGGTWATIIRVPVTWPEAPLVLYGGQGDVVQWNISHRVRLSDTVYREQTANCGIYLPDLSGAVLTNNQKFGIRFPNDMFDKNEIPPTTFTATMSMVGSEMQYKGGPVALLTGLKMMDPVNTPWPTSFPADQTPDQDMDGMPGVTVVAVDPMTDPSYNWPPVGLPPSLGADYPRASRIAVAVRTVANLHGTASDCNEIRAAVDMTQIQGKPALNSMVIDCVKTTGDPCTPDEASFLNSERPQFTPSGPGTLVSVRVQDGAGCPDVRTRLPQ